MELRIGKYDINFSLHKWFEIGFEKMHYSEDKITFRNIHLGFISLYVDTYDYIN